ncbi:hypothetical protein F5887DRAFT_951685, partial [Amanita rubescens]
MVFNQNSYIVNMLCPDGHPPFLKYRTAVIINALWFSSLLLTGSTLMICCLCRRCLQEFMNRPQFDVKHLLAFRQMRYNSLRRCKFFAICDGIHLMIPLAVLLSFFGVIILFQALGHPDLHIVIIVLSIFVFFFLVIALYPFFSSLFTRHGFYTFSPFNCQLSWLFFQWGHSILLFLLRLVSYGRSKQGPERSTRQEFGLPPLEPISLRKLVPQALASGDWLEQDCSNFFHPNNVDAIDVLLVDALVWIDSNPTIEKTSELMASIYFCICDLESPNVFARLDYGPQVARRGLAAIFHEVANRQRSDNDDACALASMLWLENHVEKMPHRSGLTSHNETNIQGGLPSEYLRTTNVLCKLLISSRSGLADGRYLKGTFPILRLLMDDKLRMAVKSPHVQQAMFAVLEECKRFFKVVKYKDHCHQAQLCADELRDFIHAAEESKQSLPNHWAEFLGKADSVYNMERGVMRNPTYSNSPQNSIVPSRSSTEVD